MMHIAEPLARFFGKNGLPGIGQIDLVGGFPVPGKCNLHLPVGRVILFALG